MNKFYTFILFFLLLTYAQAQLPNPAACYTFSGNANDGTGNGHNGTVVGATLAPDRSGNPNSAYLFDGIDDSISVPNFNTIIASDEFTITFWIKANNLKTHLAFLLAPDNPNDRLCVPIYYGSSSAAHIFDYGNIFTTGRIAISTTFVSQWEHFACVTSQSQNKMFIYKNGALLISANYSAPLINKSRTFNIGGGTGSQNENFFYDGLIDDVAIYNQALTASQISQVYQAANPCVSSSPAVPVACYPFSGNAIDATGHGHNGTVIGATLAQDRFGNPNSAYLFDGIDDSIAVPNFNTMIPADEFTITFWIKANLFKSHLAFMLSPDNASDRLCVPIYYNHNGTPYHIFDYGNISGSGRIGAATTFVSQWEHFSCVVSNSQNYMSIYKNGILWLSENHSAPLTNKNRTFNIGGGIGSQNENFFYDGWIDDVVIYDQALSASQIMQIFTDGVPCLTTAIADVITPEGFVVYPNPSDNGIYHVRFEGRSKTIYTIYNSIGENILSGNFDAQENTIDLSKFSQGIYYLQVITGEKSLSQKIIKL